MRRHTKPDIFFTVLVCGPLRRMIRARTVHNPAENFDVFDVDSMTVIAIMLASGIGQNQRAHNVVLQ